jgi:ribosomal protein L44E
MASPRAAPDGLLAKILRFCPFCGKETPHEVRTGSLGVRLSCVRCRERALLEELDRD